MAGHRRTRNSRTGRMGTVTRRTRISRTGNRRTWSRDREQKDRGKQRTVKCSKIWRNCPQKRITSLFEQNRVKRDGTIKCPQKYK